MLYPFNPGAMTSVASRAACVGHPVLHGGLRFVTNREAKLMQTSNHPSLSVPAQPEMPLLAEHIGAKPPGVKERIASNRKVTSVNAQWRLEIPWLAAVIKQAQVIRRDLSEPAWRKAFFPPGTHGSTDAGDIVIVEPIENGIEPRRVHEHVIIDINENASARGSCPCMPGVVKTNSRLCQINRPRIPSRALPKQRIATVLR